MKNKANVVNSSSWGHYVNINGKKHTFIDMKSYYSRTQRVHLYYTQVEGYTPAVIQNVTGSLKIRGRRKSDFMWGRDSLQVVVGQTVRRIQIIITIANTIHP